MHSEEEDDEATEEERDIECVQIPLPLKGGTLEVNNKKCSRINHQWQPVIDRFNNSSGNFVFYA